MCAPLRRQRSGDSIRVSFSLSKTSDSPHLSPLDTSRATPTPEWTGEHSSNPPGVVERFKYGMKRNEVRTYQPM